MAQAPSQAARPFVEYLAGHLPMVEQALLDVRAVPMARAGEGPVDDLDDYLYRPLAAFTSRGGKRVRPVLALLGAQAVGARPERALSAAVAIELFQSAALVHDDIADESDLRRGEPCLHLTEGVGPAINCGDLALTSVFEVVLDDATLPDAARLRVLRELVRMERHTLEGQALDPGWARDARWDVTSDDYLYMVDAKTAWYSAASPLCAGALAAGADEDAARGLVEVGRPAGIAFQIQDDLLNLVGDPDAQGKDFRSDVTEGKRTLAVVWALEHLDPSGREELVSILGAHTQDPALLARAVELVELGGAIEACRERARAAASASQAAAADLAARGVINDRACELLRSMADFFVERAG